MSRKRKVSLEEESELYAGVEQMIWSIIHKFSMIPVEDKKDIFQEASIFVCRELIPKFDKTRNVSFNNFSYICIRNFVTRKINNLNKRREKEIVDSQLSMMVMDEIVEENHHNDKVDKVYKMLDKQPKKFKHNERRILKMLKKNPKLTQREMSERMGFSFASGTGAILSRFRKKCKEENFLGEEE